MTHDIIIKKATGKNFCVEYKDNGGRYFAIIPRKVISKFMKCNDLYVKDAIKAVVENLKSEIIIFSLN